MSRLFFQHPHAVEAGYTRRIVYITRRAVARVMPLFRAGVEALAETQERQDADLPKEWQAALDEVRFNLFSSADMADLEKAVEQAGDQALQHVANDAFVRAQFGSFDPAEGWEGDLVERWRRRNIDLIVTIPGRLHDGLQPMVQEAFDRGWNWQKLQQRIQAKFNNSDWYAERIARDQMGKLHGQLTQQRQVSLGVKRYIWRTAGDQRVRKEHADRENTMFSWDNPPPDGHPGDAILCRCHAEPVFDEPLNDPGPVDPNDIVFRIEDLFPS